MIPFKSLVRTTAAAIALLIAGTGGPAQAQMLVHDPAAVGQLIGQAQTALSQLERLREQIAQGQQLYESLNDPSAVNALARQLLGPELRAIIPEINQLEAAARGDLSALGGLAARAQAIRDAHRTPGIASDTPRGADLEASGALAARDLALGEKVAEAASLRASGLEELRQALDAAPNARAVMDIEARLASEQALVETEQLRMQGVLMMQASEMRLAHQRAREAAEARRTARMTAFRRGFAQ